MTAGNEQDDRTYALNIANDSESWKELTNAKLSKRRNACWALDQKKNQLYVFGGTSDRVVAIRGLECLDLNQENPAWEFVDMAGSRTAPLARGSCVALYDGARDRILFGFGNTLNADHTAVRAMTDLWALSLK